MMMIFLVEGVCLYHTFLDVSRILVSACIHSTDANPKHALHIQYAPRASLRQKFLFGIDNNIKLNRSKFTWTRLTPGVFRWIPTLQQFINKIIECNTYYYIIKYLQLIDQKTSFSKFRINFKIINMKSVIFEFCRSLLPPRFRVTFPLLYEELSDISLGTLQVASPTIHFRRLLKWRVQ